jgi:peptidoglycan/LPS O-acetylase OafA/YrhL
MEGPTHPGTGSAARGRDKLSALTGLRFFAAAHVVLFHQPILTSHLPGPTANIFHAGYVSVGLFFVLSGFVLAYNYLGRLDGQPGALRTFWSSRFARIYPAYMLALLLALPLSWLAAPGSPESATPGTALYDLTSNGPWSYLAVLTLSQSWFPQVALAWNGPAWSLSVEMFFYLAFPFLIGPVGRLGARAALAVLVGVWLLGLAFPAFYLVAQPDGPVSANAGSSYSFWLWVLRYNPLLHLPEFVVGVLLGRVYLLKSARIAAVAGARSGVVSQLLPVGAAAAALVLLTFSHRLPYPLLHNGLLTPLFGLLVYSLADGRSWLSRLLALPPLLLLGEASYGVYILQDPVLQWTKQAMVRLSGDAGAGSTQLAALVFLGLLLAISVAAFFWVETPARGLLRRALGGASKRERRVPASVPSHSLG